MVAARRSPLAGLAPVLAAFALIAAACTGGGENSGQGSGGIDDANASTVATDRDRGVIDLGVFDAPSVDESLLSIDDDIRIGTLDNGLTYYLRSNDRPGGSLSLRLAVKAGGIDENPIGTGAAHFLEHMMFNGTEQFPATHSTRRCAASALRSVPTSTPLPTRARPSTNSMLPTKAATPMSHSTSWLNGQPPRRSTRPRSGPKSPSFVKSSGFATSRAKES